MSSLENAEPLRTWNFLCLSQGLAPALDFDSETLRKLREVHLQQEMLIPQFKSLRLLFQEIRQFLVPSTQLRQ